MSYDDRPHQYKEFVMPRPTFKEAYERGVEAGKTRVWRPTIPYMSKGLVLAFIQGFESVRPWPYKNS